MTDRHDEEIAVSVELAKLNTKMDNLVRTNDQSHQDIIKNNTEMNKTIIGHLMKLIAGLVGIICANIGLKFVGSPPWVIICVYMSIFAGVFLTVMMYYQWKELTRIDRAIRGLFIVLVLFSSLCREFVFDPALGTPCWYTPIIDSFLTSLCILFILRSWRRKK